MLRRSDLIVPVLEILEIEVSIIRRTLKTCKKYVDGLNRQSEKYQNMFKDIENMSPDKILAKEYKQPTVFKS